MAQKGESQLSFPLLSEQLTKPLRYLLSFFSSLRRPFAVGRAAVKPPAKPFPGFTASSHFAAALCTPQFSPIRATPPVISAGVLSESHCENSLYPRVCVSSCSALPSVSFLGEDGEMLAVIVVIVRPPQEGGGACAAAAAWYCQGVERRRGCETAAS